METIKKQLETYQIEINKQKSSCPITDDLSIDRIDHCLKEFVDCQRKYLSMRNTTELTKFKESMTDKDLSQALSTYQLTTNQVSPHINFRTMIGIL